MTVEQPPLIIPEAKEEQELVKLIGQSSRRIVKEVVRINPIKEICLLTVSRYDEEGNPLGAYRPKEEGETESGVGERWIMREKIFPPSNEIEEVVIRGNAFHWTEIDSLVNDMGANNRQWLIYLWNPKHEAIKPLWFVTIISKVRIDGDKFLYIPMLDYRCPINSENEALIVADLQSQGQRGWVLRSGASYHFLGYDLFDLDAQTKFFESNGSNPLVDPKFIKKSTAAGYGSLRITGRKEHKFWQTINDYRVGIFLNRPVKFVYPERHAPKVVAFV